MERVSRQRAGPLQPTSSGTEALDLLSRQPSLVDDGSSAQQLQNHAADFDPRRSAVHNGDVVNDEALDPPDVVQRIVPQNRLGAKTDEECRVRWLAAKVQSQ